MGRLRREKRKGVEGGGERSFGGCDESRGSIGWKSVDVSLASSPTWKHENRGVKPTGKWKLPASSTHRSRPIPGDPDLGVDKIGRSVVGNIGC